MFKPLENGKQLSAALRLPADIMSEIHQALEKCRTFNLWLTKLLMANKK